mgnify:CR=1 FL=1
MGVAAGCKRQIGELLMHVRRGAVAAVHSLRGGTAEALEGVAHGDAKTSHLVGRRIEQIKLPEGARIGAIVRGEGSSAHTVVPTHDVVIEPDAFVDSDGKGFVTRVGDRFHAGLPDPALTRAGNSLDPLADRTVMSFIFANSAPTLTNLNGDSVAWAGVGNTVTLDAGGNAALADADLGALNSGNGNWAGASLTVQRAGTANTSIQQAAARLAEAAAQLRTIEEMRKKFGGRSR